jgi:hypothetical protein
LALLDQCQDEYWGLVHEPITSPKRMLLVMGTIALRLAQEGHTGASQWLLDQCQGEAPLNRRKATQDRRQGYRQALWTGTLPEQRSIVRRSADHEDVPE